MPFPRRSFLQFASTGAVANMIAAPLQAARADAQPADANTDSDGMEYWFLGNGKLIAVLQTIRKKESGATHCGLILLSADHIVSKQASPLFSGSSGLSGTRLFADVDGKRSWPGLDAAIGWRYPSGIPTVVISWEADGIQVEEQLTCPAGASVLLRTVRVKNPGPSARKIAISGGLLPNGVYFDGLAIDSTRGIVAATGYHRLEFFAFARSAATERVVTVDFGEVPPGGGDEAIFGYALDENAGEIIQRGAAALGEQTAAYWRGAASLSTGNGLLDHLYRTSQSGLRANVSSTGKMNGGPFQYGGEWVRDSSMYAIGSVLAGLPDIGRAVLDRLISDKTDSEGRASEFNAYRPDETIELDQNAELVYAVWTYWVWTGDGAFLRQHWEKLRRVADFSLRPVFRDPATGLLKSSREFWERTPIHGFTPGYELAYQVWNVVGLRAGAEMAGYLGDSDSQARWAQASSQLRNTILQDRKFSFIENGRFIKRRLVSGEAQRTVTPPDRSKIPESMPLHFEQVSRCDPDATLAYPIIFGLVDPSGPVARATLDALETLWNQRWSGGGYGRYDVTSEPDSPGPWPFGSMFITRAHLEAGDDDEVWRTLRWLGDVQGGRSGAWFEFYGERPIPPLPRVGIIPWTWAELQMMFVNHMLGLRPSPSELVVRPRLLRGLRRVEARLPFNGHVLNLSIVPYSDKSRASLDGKPVPVRDGRVQIPRPARDSRLEIWICTPPGCAG